MQHSTIGLALPEQIYLMTFEPWKENSFLIRFEHLLEKNEDPELSKPVTFNLTRVFPGDFVFAELTLAANQWIDDLNRIHFKQEGEKNLQSGAKSTSENVKGFKVLSNMEITLKPMEIRTFIMSPPVDSNNTARSQSVFKLFPILIFAVILKHLHGN